MFTLVTLTVSGLMEGRLLRAFFTSVAPALPDKGSVMDTRKTVIDKGRSQNSLSVTTNKPQRLTNVGD